MHLHNISKFLAVDRIHIFRTYCINISPRSMALLLHKLLYEKYIPLIFWLIGGIIGMILNFNEVRQSLDLTWKVRRGCRYVFSEKYLVIFYNLTKIYSRYT